MHRRVQRGQLSGSSEASEEYKRQLLSQARRNTESETKFLVPKERRADSGRSSLVSYLGTLMPLARQKTYVCYRFVDVFVQVSLKRLVFLKVLAI